VPSASKVISFKPAAEECTCHEALCLSCNVT